MDNTVGLMILGFGLGALDVIAIALMIWHGRYLARMNERMLGGDMSIFMQGRQSQEILKEMRDMLRARA